MEYNKDGILLAIKSPPHKTNKESLERKQDLHINKYNEVLVARMVCNAIISIGLLGAAALFILFTTGV